MKTTLLCFLLVSGLFGLSFSCCSWVPDYWNVTSFQAEIRDSDGITLPLNDTISTDSIYLVLSFGQELLGDNLNLAPNPFISHAHATSCPEPGELGMQDELIDIEITSSLAFNSYLPGNSLSPMLSINNLPIQAWIENKGYSPYYQDTWLITFPTKPSANSNTHDFKIRLSFNSGRVEELQLGAFTWN